jgi:hypothetical protein
MTFHSQAFTRTGVFALLLISFAMLAAQANALPPVAPPTPTQAEIAALTKGSYTFKSNGWTYIHLAGTPRQIGFQHGYLLRDEIEDNLSVYRLEARVKLKKEWPFMRDAAKTILWPKLEPEYQEELNGIVEGLRARGSMDDLWDVVALNAYEELTGYVRYYDATHKQPMPVDPAVPGKCSAFIATGTATKDGKIVIAHNNWSSYAEGERWTIVFDIIPAKGHHIFMDGSPGMITSQDDFGVNDAGLMITETTLPRSGIFDPNGTPEFMRSRKAMQYATSINEYADIMRKGNNGGYANAWLVGDRKTNEIGYLELGLHHTPLTIKKDGYFVSANFAVDPAVIRDDTRGFNPNNLASSPNARHIREDQFMHEHYGKLDTLLAEAYLSDHYDSYEKKIKAGFRSLCGHEDQATERDPGWNAPPGVPSGAVTGKVMDANMAARLSFTARAGHPCGEDFLAAPFFAAHSQYEWEKPILHDMIAGPWTTFTAGETAPKAHSNGN